MAHMRKDYGGLAGLALILWALIFGAYLLIKPFFIADESPHSLPHRQRHRRHGSGIALRNTALDSG